MKDQQLNQVRDHKAQGLAQRCAAAGVATANTLWKWLNSPPQPRIPELTALQGQAHLSPYVRMRIDTHV